MARRAYVGDFTFRLGPIQTRGKLMSIRKSKDSGLNLMTPQGLPVHMVFRDVKGNVFVKDELGRGRPDKDGNLIAVDTAAVEEAKKSTLPNNIFDLQVHPRADIDNFLYPDDSNGYVFLPIIKNSSGKVIDDPANVKWYEILNHLVRDPKLAFVGKCCVNGTESMYRLGMYRGHVVVQRQLFPEEVNEFDTFKPTLSRDEKAKVAKLAEALLKPFDPDDYVNEVTQRVIEASQAEFDPTKVRTIASVQYNADITSALDAALAEFS